MLRTVFAAGLTALALASAASAATHNVVITGNGFFPTITYLNPGDYVRFFNAANFDVRVVAEDNDNATENWHTDDIDPNEFEWVYVIEESLLSFEMHGQRWVGGAAQGEGEATDREGSTNTNETEGFWEDFVSQGEFTFDPVQLQ